MQGSGGRERGRERGRQGDGRREEGEETNPLAQDPIEITQRGSGIWS